MFNKRKNYFEKLYDTDFVQAQLFLEINVNIKMCIELNL